MELSKFSDLFGVKKWDLSFGWVRVHAKVISKITLNVPVFGHQLSP